MILITSVDSHSMERMLWPMNMNRGTGNDNIDFHWYPKYRFNEIDNSNTEQNGHVALCCKNIILFNKFISFVKNLT